MENPDPETPSAGAPAPRSAGGSSRARRTAAFTLGLSTWTWALRSASEADRLTSRRERAVRFARYGLATLVAGLACLAYALADAPVTRAYTNGPFSPRQSVTYVPAVLFLALAWVLRALTVRDVALAVREGERARGEGAPFDDSRALLFAVPFGSFFVLADLDARLHALADAPPLAPSPATAPGPLATFSARASRALPTAMNLAVVGALAGVALRVWASWNMDFRADGNTYTAMGQALALTHSFTMPWGDVTTVWKASPAPSHHYPPLYPAYLAVFYATLGFHLWVSKAAALVASLASLAVVWACTRDLYGREKAWIATAIVALDPHLMWATGTGFSENLVVVFFALTMWAILKSLDKPAFILLAGFFAALAYLSRASIGWFFLIAGAGGFAWRFYYVRWKVLTNPWYLAAIALFGAIWLAWAIRNVLDFGWYSATIAGYDVSLPNWQTSSYTEFVTAEAFRQPEKWAFALWKKIPLFAAYLAWPVLFFLPELGASVRRIREEHESALWLSVLLVFLLGWIFTALFWVYENSDLYWHEQNRRYVVIAFVPLAWLLVRRARVDGKAFALRAGALFATLILACVLVQLTPIRQPDIAAAQALEPMLEAGDTIGLDGHSIKYAFYAYLAHPERVTIWLLSSADNETVVNAHDHPVWILTLKPWATYPGYLPVRTFDTHYRDGGTISAEILVRDDVASARGVRGT